VFTGALDTIPYFAFYYCKKLSSVTLVSVSTVVGYAFSECSSLRNVVYGGTGAEARQINVERYNAAFKGANWTASDESGFNLYTVAWTLEDGTLTASGSGVAENPPAGSKSQATRVVIEPGITEIGDSAFAGFTILQSVSIADTVTKIGESPFFECYSLTSITIPDSVTTIGRYAFYRSGLRSIVIPETVTELGDYLFSDCKSLTQAELRCRCSSIDALFDNCPALTTVSLPGTLTEIGYGTFNGCSSLKSVYFHGTQSAAK